MPHSEINKRSNPSNLSGVIGQKITAVLGPTNTGKTHFAIERMLGHRSGMIGLPLRLLAREVYDKIIELKGSRDGWQLKWLKLYTKLSRKLDRGCRSS